MNSAPSYFCTFLKAWRKARNLYKKEAASLLRIPLRTYESWEFGANVPSEIVRVEIARRVGAYNQEQNTKHAQRKSSAP